MSQPAENPSQTLLVTSRFRVEQVDRRLADGTVKRREVVRHPGAVTILPLVAPDRVCLIRNYRVSVGQTLIELPAGTLEPGEDPQRTAVRELQEETGYQAGRMELLHTFYLSPGILDERMHLYLATDLRPGPAARERGEEIENLLTAWDEALRMASDGTIRDAKTLVGLLLYERLRRAG